MKRPSIPAVTNVKDPTVAAILRPIKENVEQLGGLRGNAIAKLVFHDAELLDALSEEVLSTATLTEVIDRVNLYGTILDETVKKLNEVIERLNP